MPARVKQSACVSPIAAYAALAPYYDRLIESRKEYLQAVEQIVASYAHGASSMLDIGSGNGVRALRIAQAAGIEDVVLVEPSPDMRRYSPSNTAVWKSSASEISQNARFDLITCLWNVLGHLDGVQERSSMLARLKNFLSPSGLIFLDVNHRYNATSYGWLRTAGRMLRDAILPSESNGDVIASWQAGHQRISTRGHVFTHAEVVRLFKRAGLRVAARWIIDYQTGMQRRFPVLGNLLYQLTTEATYTRTQSRNPAMN